MMSMPRRRHGAPNEIERTGARGLVRIRNVDDVARVDKVGIRPPAPERGVPGMIVNRAPASEPEAPRDHRQVVVLNDGVAPTHDLTSGATERANLPARGRKAGERDLNLAVRVIGDGRFAPRVQRAL